MYIVVYETWLDHEDTAQDFLGVFDTEQEAQQFMNEYSNIHELGVPEQSPYFIGHYYNLSPDTLDGESYRDGHCFRIYKITLNPDPKGP